jgi:hypothetical protein
MKFTPEARAALSGFWEKASERLMIRAKNKVMILLFIWKLILVEISLLLIEGF